MLNRSLTVAVSVVVGLLSFTAVAYACSPELWLRQGAIPGLGNPFALDAGDELPAVPRNVATRDSTLLVDGVRVEWTRLAEDGQLSAFRRSDALLPTGALLTEGETDIAIVGDYEDTDAPDAPMLIDGHYTFVDVQDEGCEPSPCGPQRKVSVTIEVPNDDHALGTQLIYAVFLGATIDEVMTSADASSVASPHDGTTVTVNGGPDGRRALFVSIAAIDLAGNVGARSEALRVVDADDDEDSCAVTRAGRRQLGTLSLLVAALLLIARRGRHASNRRAHGVAGSDASKN